MFRGRRILGHWGHATLRTRLRGHVTLRTCPPLELTPAPPLHTHTHSVFTFQCRILQFTLKSSTEPICIFGGNQLIEILWKPIDIKTNALVKLIVQTLNFWWLYNFGGFSAWGRIENRGKWSKKGETSSCRQDKTRQDMTWHDMTRQDKTWDDMTRQDKKRQDKTRQHVDVVSFGGRFFLLLLTEQQKSRCTYFSS